ncbi:MAG: O-antigen ligase family protein, partial [Terracidiphilus sp.]
MATAVYTQARTTSTAPARDYTLVVSMGAIAVLVAGCYFVGLAGVLRIGYPVACFGAGVWIYTRSRPKYVTFTCWIWFLTAFVRRLADYKGGYQEPSIILIAPYLVTAVSGLDLFTRGRELLRPRSIPFLCALGAILYGTLVGLTRFSPRQMGPVVLNWLVPVFFAFFIVASYREYEEIRRSLQSTFGLATLVMGAYGVYQFFVLPGWDKLWLSNVKTTTFGVAEPLQLRGFSTMNAPVIFALTMMGTLLVSLVLRNKFRLLVVVCGFLGLLFSFNRSGWIGLIAGTIFILAKLDMRERMRVLGGLLLAIIAAWLVIGFPDVRQPVIDKLQSMTDPKDDISLHARIEGYVNAFSTLSDEPYGEGVASPDILHGTVYNDDQIGPHDSMVLELIYSLGWCGAVVYLIGLAIMV